MQKKNNFRRLRRTCMHACALKKVHEPIALAIARMDLQQTYSTHAHETRARAKSLSVNAKSTQQATQLSTQYPRILHFFAKKFAGIKKKYYLCKKF